MTSKLDRLSRGDWLYIVWLDDDGCHKDHFEVDSKMTTPRSITIEASTDSKSIRVSEVRSIPSEKNIKEKSGFGDVTILSVSPAVDGILWDLCLTLIGRGVAPDDAFDVFVVELAPVSLAWYAHQRGQSVETIRERVDAVITALASDIEEAA